MWYCPRCPSSPRIAHHSWFLDSWFEDDSNGEFLAVNHVAIPCTSQAFGRAHRGTSPFWSNWSKRCGECEIDRPRSLFYQQTQEKRPPSSSIFKKRRGGGAPTSSLLIVEKITPPKSPSSRGNRLRRYRYPFACTGAPCSE